MKANVEKFANGHWSTEVIGRRIAANAEVASKRLKRIGRQRPFLSVAVALAAGYVTGRLVTRL